ncbi:MAG: HK97 gp10 family phage protein [Eubacteriales bacterium]
MSNISVNQLANEIAKDLAEYTKDIIEGIDEASEKISKNAVKKLKQDSPKNTKKYSKGWAVKTEKKYGETNSHIIYNKNKPGLTHLLEYGHAKRGGGRVQGKSHIRPVEEQVINEFTAEVEKVVKGG